VSVASGAPPVVVERLLSAALAASPYRDDIVGDLRETYAALSARRTAIYARAWYCTQAIRLIARFAWRRPPADNTRRHAMDRLWMDLRLAGRGLVKRPLFALSIIVTLALGIGANVAVFGVIDALLIHPFELKDVDRIVMPMATSPKWTGHRETVSPADFLDWRRDFKGGAIEHLAAADWWDANLVGRDEPERVLGFFVSPAFFQAFDATPAIGRTLLPEEEVPANANRVVLSDGLWRRRFGADPAVVGQAILIDGRQWTVVGVMPAAFVFPMRAEIWAPLAFDEATARNRSRQYLTVFGRLAPGRSLGEANSQLAAITQRLAHDHPETNAQLGSQVLTLSRGMADVGVPSVLALWQAAGVFVLLIACANIANLLLARAAEREREIAIRLALGSSRLRVVRESFLESALLVAASAPVALSVAWASLRVMHGLMPARIIRFIAGWDRMGLNGWTIAIGLVCAAIAAAVSATLPALNMSFGVVSDALKTDGRTGAGPGRQRIRRLLVVAEIALALPLLVAAVLSASTITRFFTSWQGYDPDGVLTMRASLPASRYPDAATRRRFAERALDELASIPGGRAVAIGNVVPALDSNWKRSIEISGQPLDARSKAPEVDYRAISPQYFDVLRMPVLAGRPFAREDRDTAEPVVIVSEMFARKFWTGGDALDRRLRIDGGPWLRVVGICGDVVHDWFDGRVPTVYVPLAQAPIYTLTIAVRTQGDPMALVTPARAALARVDPQQPLFDVMSLRNVLGDRTISLKYIAGVMGAFAGLAVLLAVLGLYAIMTFLVARRVREIGVRIALGASRRDVVRLALSQAMRLTAAGVGIGLLLAIALSRAMEAGLLGIVSSDLRLTTALAALLAATAIAAGYLPARRAASVDPMTALRAE
jgi:predicted permease